MSETVELDRESNPLAVRGYAYYDWAKSSFETSVTVAVLPLWFAYLFLKANGLTTTIGSIDFTSDAIWSFSVSGAALLVALLSPSFGVIADRRAIKMWWLKILTYVGAGGTVLLAAAPLLPISTQWVWLMVMFVIANVGLNGASVFYNSLLPHMGTDDEMDSISNKAFAYGYFGGGILLAIHLVMTLILVDSNGDMYSWVIPSILASSGVWWYGFALLTFKWVPEPPIENEMEALSISDSAKLAFSEIRKTLSEIPKFKTLFIYMLAYFFFIDGINTVTALGGIYGPVVLGITTTFLMVAILMVQIVAAPSALGFTKLAERIGTKQALTVSLVGWIVLCFAALSFAPLELDNHNEHDIMYEWDESSNQYRVSVSSSAPSLAQKIDFSDSEFDEQEWVRNLKSYLPIIQDEFVVDYELYDWQWEENNEIYLKTVPGSYDEIINTVLPTFENTRFSVSIQNEDGVTFTSNVGIDHPTNLGDGALDFIPETARTYVWAPLGLSVGIQFIILGASMGSVLGGSQGLARSLFGQMVPETRSAEFFGFFGFFGKVAALLGPLIYGIMTVLFDSRVGILSIAILILAGTIILRGVDVDQGRLDAQAEDARNRGFN
ncbi:MAG: MFS transporter [Candidatus Thalassarchaeaceae archaeon]|tara:strand:+ start:71505 stop:73328 length:1824 start_codon:yes stop_codon:yes gene_type:complete